MRMVSILRMEVLTIRDVFILNFAPVSLSVSPPRTPRVCHAFQQQATDNCRVGQTATQDMSCMQSKVCSTAQELTGSQHSSWNIVLKLSPQPALRNCKEAASLLIFGICSCYWWNASNVSALVLSEREAYDKLSFIPICSTIMYVFSAGTHT